MSGTASVPTQFQNAVTATGLQLDNNFSTIVAYLNDPTNRNNYAADTGNTNTIALAFTPPFVGGYTAGMEITFKAAFSNSGATVVNVNGLGNANLVNPDGTALTVSALTAGSIYKAAYDGTNFIFLSAGTRLSSATQGEMETATATAAYVNPQKAIFHPGVAKAWARFAGNNATVGQTITPIASYNVASIVRTGTGTYSIAFANSFSAATNYMALAVGNGTSTLGVAQAGSTHLTQGVVISFNTVTTQAPADTGALTHFVAYGDLA